MIHKQAPCTLLINSMISPTITTTNINVRREPLQVKPNIQYQTVFHMKKHKSRGIRFQHNIRSIIVVLTRSQSGIVMISNEPRVHCLQKCSNTSQNTSIASNKHPNATSQADYRIRHKNSRSNQYMRINISLCQ